MLTSHRKLCIKVLATILNNHWDNKWVNKEGTQPGKHFLACIPHVYWGIHLWAKRRRKDLRFFIRLGPWWMLVLSKWSCWLPRTCVTPSVSSQGEHLPGLKTDNVPTERRLPEIRNWPHPSSSGDTTWIMLNFGKGAPLEPKRVVKTKLCRKREDGLGM